MRHARVPAPSPRWSRDARRGPLRPHARQGRRGGWTVPGRPSRAPQICRGSSSGSLTRSGGGGGAPPPHRRTGRGEARRRPGASYVSGRLTLQRRTSSIRWTKCRVDKSPYALRKRLEARQRATDFGHLGVVPLNLPQFQAVCGAFLADVGHPNSLGGVSCALERPRRRLRTSRATACRTNIGQPKAARRSISWPDACPPAFCPFARCTPPNQLRCREHQGTAAQPDGTPAARFGG